MRETGEFYAAPTLADALQDAGCDDDVLLSGLRQPGVPKWMLEALVAQVHSDEAAAAVAALEAFAVSVGYTYAQVVEGTRRYVTSGQQYGGDRSMDDYNAAWAAESAFRPPNYGVYADDPIQVSAFHTAFERVTGTTVPDKRRRNPFTCPC
jgi:hypothetical protein